MLIAAADAAAAVRMAEEMKRRGSHEWFRGQRCNWTLQSSLNRDPARYEESVRRARRFGAWLLRTPGLEALHADADARIAVAQHYGLPTHFIDFSTEPSVAGYFATEDAPLTDPAQFDLELEERRFFGSQPPSASVGCILCVNRQRCLEVWDSVAKVLQLAPDLHPEFIEIDVPDLWRLEAQHGVFMYCPLPGFEEKVYDFDRIVFPHRGPLAEPPRERIYPERKSHLEIQLDQYFLQEQLLAWSRLQHESGFRRALPQTLHLDAAPADGLPPHDSWQPDRLQPYIAPLRQSFLASLSTETWSLDTIDAAAGASAWGAAVHRHLLQRLRCEPGARAMLPRWDCAVPGLATAATRVWDGLRQLPCSDDDLAAALGLTAALCRAAAGHADGEAASAACLGGPVQKVEFGTPEGGISRAYVAVASLRAAFRDDLAGYLAPHQAQRLAHEPGTLLLDFPHARHLFPFDRFARLFVREAVPSQVVWWGDGSFPTLFSPARIDVFGLP